MAVAVARRDACKHGRCMSVPTCMDDSDPGEEPGSSGGQQSCSEAITQRQELTCLHDADRLRVQHLLAWVALMNELEALRGGGVVVDGAAAGHEAASLNAWQGQERGRDEGLRSHEVHR